MDAKQFFCLVEKMRNRQKEYFRSKTTAALRESKQYEQMVDAEIHRVNQILHERQNPKLNF